MRDLCMQKNSTRALPGKVRQLVGPEVNANLRNLRLKRGVDMKTSMSRIALGVRPVWLAAG
eukprot:12420115-Karenia_brevis.AAC.1